MKNFLSYFFTWLFLVLIATICFNALMPRGGGIYFWMAVLAFALAVLTKIHVDQSERIDRLEARIRSLEQTQPPKQPE